MRIVKNAIHDFDGYASQPVDYSVDWSKVFDVLNAILQGAAIILPEVRVGVAISEAGIKVIGCADVKDDPKTSPTPPSTLGYAAVLKAFAQSLNDLRATIEYEESGAQTAMIDDIHVIGENNSQSFYPLNPMKDVDEGKDLGSVDVVRVTEGDREKVDFAMKEIVTVLTSARDQLAKQAEASPWERPCDVGLGPTGFFPVWVELLWSFYTCIGELAGEVTDSRLRFSWGVKALEEANDEVARKLKDYADSMAGNRHHPDLNNEAFR